MYSVEWVYQSNIYIVIEKDILTDTDMNCLMRRLVWADFPNIKRKYYSSFVVFVMLGSTVYNINYDRKLSVKWVSKENNQFVKKEQEIGIKNKEESFFKTMHTQWIFLWYLLEIKLSTVLKEHTFYF